MRGSAHSPAVHPASNSGDDASDTGLPIVDVGPGGSQELKRANEILLAASSFFARELDPRLPW
jgi:transposase